MAIKLVSCFRGALEIDFPYKCLRNRFEDGFARAAIEEGWRLTYFVSGAALGIDVPYEPLGNPLADWSLAGLRIDSWGGVRGFIVVYPPGVGNQFWGAY